MVIIDKAVRVKSFISEISALLKDAISNEFANDDVIILNISDIS